MYKVITMVAGIALAVAFAFYTHYYNSEEAEQERDHINLERERRRRNSTRRSDENIIRQRRSDIMGKLSNDCLVCPICQERCYHREQVWFCRECCSAYHYICIRRWFSENNTCPSCRCTVRLPALYTCLCGRVENPRHNINILPHTCNLGCMNCGESCHPGPCL
ncbi:transcriptional repressor NF-X1 [Cimex lectularius]|uniref:RING-type domain-containing protein n=1 Tax=Cimex lectularius TaxID=79782 RepID=A0A8I6RT48_CIMLE|nr:transcriptional repressor NF-X1 [Cimex lectularius]XP_014250905.1 transcriptional repressor NF-X1 [Cimex lectularius]XP_014250906.1 transcriptional repressor NF-X1 [Cimex lectularius]